MRATRTTAFTHVGLLPPMHGKNTCLYFLLSLPSTKKNSLSMKSQLRSVRKRSAPSLTEIPFLQDESRQDAKPNIYLITSCKAHLQPKFYPPCDLEFASRGKLRNQRITMGNEYEALQERVKPIWSVYP